MRARSMVLVVLAAALGVFAPGCDLFQVKLTPEEKVRMDELTDKLDNAATESIEASANSRALAGAVAELANRTKVVISQIASLAAAVQDGSVDYNDGLALWGKLTGMKEDLEESLPELKKMADAAATDAVEAKAAVDEVMAETKAFEKAVEDRVEAEGGDKPGVLAVVIATIGTLLTGGGAIKIIGTIGRLVAEVKKWKTAFKVTSAGAAVDDDGKASDEVKAKIKVALAGSTLSEDELEILRVAARDDNG
ncbi:MAG: hypothetical protein JRL30_01115 [Deltaproteobacteria bacterium]|nr:hypothetical protein [Deltaproteobacteria bacterium]